MIKLNEDRVAFSIETPPGVQIEKILQTGTHHGEAYLYALVQEGPGSSRAEFILIATGAEFECRILEGGYGYVSTLLINGGQKSFHLFLKV